MKRVLLTISYDGTAYHGWQVQPNGITVQQTMQDALEKLLGSRPAVTGCSRTDAGVHAKEFCCHLDCEERIPEKAFVKGLNGILPEDIAVLSCRRVSDDFHARYNAKGKTYSYYFLNSLTPNPFCARYAWQVERNFSIDRMNAFCEMLIGTHDFAAFSSSGRSVEDTVRTVRECHVHRQGDQVIFTVTADGFLYNMVRIMVGTALAVSDGKTDPADAYTMFQTGNRALTGETAPPHGLFLEKVWY